MIAEKGWVMPAAVETLTMFAAGELPHRAPSLDVLASCFSEALSMPAARYACHNLFAHAAAALAKLTFGVPFARYVLAGIGLGDHPPYRPLLACWPPHLLLERLAGAEDGRARLLPL